MSDQTNQNQSQRNAASGSSGGTRGGNTIGYGVVFQHAAAGARVSGSGSATASPSDSTGNAGFGGLSVQSMAIIALGLIGVVFIWKRGGAS